LLSLGFGVFVLFLLYQVLVPALDAQLGSSPAAAYLFWLPGMLATSASSWSPWTIGLSYYIFYSSVGFLLGQQEAGAKEVTWVIGRIVLIVSLGVFIGLLWILGGDFTGLVQQVEQAALEFLTQLEATVSNSSAPQVQGSLLTSYGPQFAFYVARALPAILINTIILLAWFNIVVARHLGLKKRFFAQLAPLKEWRFPFWGVWVVIAFGLLLLGDYYLWQSPGLRVLSFNSFLILGLIYFLQGVAIAVFYLGRLKIPPLFKLLVYVVFIFLLLNGFGMLVLALGFFDSWFNFRKLKPTENSA